MRHLVAITALSLFAFPAFAQQPPTVELPTAAVVTVMNAYLHPSRVEPGDALAAVNLLASTISAHEKAQEPKAPAPQGIKPH